ncbi:MAG: class I SAM-dependent methyltransferase [Candidatus Krumholzibacteriia bacterium]
MSGPVGSRKQDADPAASADTGSAAGADAGSAAGNAAGAAAGSAAGAGARAHRGPVLAERDGRRVIDCVACGFRHVDPLPTPEELQLLYAREFYEDRHAGYIASHERDREWWRITHQALYERLERLLGGAPGRICDVGSGPGLFLALGRERGWDVVGVEPGHAAAQHARDALGLVIVEDFFTTATAARVGECDVVHLHNVLEHVLDPVALVSVAAAVVPPGGLLAVTAPNDFNALQLVAADRLGHAPWWVNVAEHLNYFDGPSLERLLAGVGFTPVERTGSFPLELFLLMGDDYINDKERGAAMHARRKRLESTLTEAGRADLLADIYDRLAAAGLGRTVTVIARRHP